MCKTPGAYKGRNLYFGTGGCEGGCPCEQVLISLSTDRKFAYLGLNGMDWSKYVDSCRAPSPSRHSPSMLTECLKQQGTNPC